MWLEWKLAVVLAVALALVVAALTAAEGRCHRRWQAVAATFGRETAIVLALYAAWQRAGQLSVMQGTDARARALSIWNFERALRLPSELSLQAAVLPHPLWVQACNAYYAIVHVPSLGIFLVWMFVCHRRQYPRVRNTIALLTGASLAIQLVPVAPPRMLPALGFVDTALQYNQSVYVALGSRAGADQLSAMPSVHVGWAVVIGVVVMAVGTSRWRWIAFAHAVITILVVAATANHFWMDGIVAVVVLGAAWLVEWSRGAVMAKIRRVSVPRLVPVRALWLRPRPAPAPAPAPAPVMAGSPVTGSWVGTDA